MKWFKSNYQQLLAVLIIVVVGIVAMWPLTHPGLFTAHDIWHQVARFYHYHASISDGFWPPGWIITLANNYGYPLFYFSYHLPWMIGVVLLRLGFAIPEALKLLYGGAFVLSGLTMYWFCWSVTKKLLPALVGAVVYLLAPYHFLTVYVAAALGSVFQFVFVPLMFLGVYEIVVKKSQQRGVLILVVGLTASVLSHLMSVVMVAPFLALWTFLLLLFHAQRNKHRWLQALGRLFLAGLLAFLLSAFYLLPLMAYKSAILADTNGGFSSLYTTNFVSLKQLLYSPWGFGPITSNVKDGEISMQVGVAQWLGVALLLGILSLLLVDTYLVPRSAGIRWFVKRIRLDSWLETHQDRHTGAIVLLLFALVCFSMLSASTPVWELASSLLTLDYPWRQLVLAVFFGSVAVGIGLSFFKPLALQLMLVVFFIATAWYTNRNHIGVNLYTDIPVADYVDAEITTNTFSEYLPVGTNDKFILVTRPWILEPDTLATASGISATQLNIDAWVKNDGWYTLHHYAFPTLSVTVDDQPTPIKKSGEMLISVPLSSGQHRISVHVVRTPIVILGYMLSIITLIGLIAYGLIQRYTHQHAKK